MDNRKQLDDVELIVKLTEIAVNIKQLIPQQWSLWGEHGSVNIDIECLTNGLFDIVKTLIDDCVDDDWFTVIAGDSVLMEIHAVWGVEALDFQFNSYDVTYDGSSVYHTGINQHYTIRKSDICK